MRALLLAILLLATGTPLDVAFERFRAEDWEGALGAAKIWLASHPDDPNALGIAGGCQLRLGYVDEAVASFRRAAKAEPKRTAFRKQLGFALLEKARAGTDRAVAVGAASEAADVLATVLAEEPSDRDSLQARAIALGAAERVDEAVEAHRAWEAASYDPWEARLSLAGVYARAARWDDVAKLAEGWCADDPWRAAEPVADAAVVLFDAGRLEDADRLLDTIVARASASNADPRGTRSAWGTELLRHWDSTLGVAEREKFLAGIRGLLGFDAEGKHGSGAVRLATGAAETLPSGSDDSFLAPPARIGDARVTIPSRSVKADPAYARFALLIDKDGTVRFPVPLGSNDAAFERLVREATAQWRYRPAGLGKRPVEYPALIEVTRSEGEVVVSEWGPG